MTAHCADCGKKIPDEPLRFFCGDCLEPRMMKIKREINTRTGWRRRHGV